ncbi:MarR family winged helix-turn-helix transcriptional regulator [Bacillus suaedae]|uniref:MarR family transcriptional regulator n=1 Tax=Halalkalibacter suaedae TaxID=2822140 RepID=A0A941AQ57_9BACI|nr:MarR family transcriptional regulator [Bacillus suaedae]MBP3952257.1 MarR family transcriptional regulator [Bacillus suaedae]
MEREIELGLELARTYLAFRRSVTRLLTKHDLTVEQFSIISQLNKMDGLSQKKLAEQTERDQTTVGKILDKVVKKDLVVRKEDPNDRRAVVLSITPKGRELITQVYPEVMTIQDQAFQGMGEDETNTFIQSLFKIYNNIK